MKRFLALVLAVLMLFALCACGKKTEPAATPTAAPTAAPAEPAAPDPSSIEGQLNLIYSSLSQLSAAAEYQSFYYTVTDFDHDDYLEVFAAVTEGNAAYTRGDMYEVSDDYTTLTKVSFSNPNGDYLPEVIVKSCDTYVSGGVYNYIYTDTSSVGMAGHYITTQAMTKNDNTLQFTNLGYQDVEYFNGNTVYVFADKNGNLLDDPSDFDKLAANEFPGATKTTTNFDWFTLPEVTSVARLATSYNVFAGDEVAPVSPSTPVPIITPAPTSYIVVDVPVVTKNPTTEYIYEGGSCDFVAYATGYQSMLWKLVDPSGNVYDATRTPYAAILQVSGVTSPNLRLSNVPVEMNGWSAYAEFYGKTTVQSGRAMLYVSKAPVQVLTVTAAPGSGSYFTDYSNYVTLYSSNGASIHYEAIKSGDTGPYDSGTIASGQGFCVTGIEGQCITVQVYANVEPSGKTCTFTYTVDRTPAPQPTPDPQPTEQSAPGVIGQQESMNWVPITVNGVSTGCSRDFIYPQGADIVAGTPCTVYYIGSLDNITRVQL